MFIKLIKYIYLIYKNLKILYYKRVIIKVFIINKVYNILCKLFLYIFLINNFNIYKNIYYILKDFYIILITLKYKE
jgi:hypothetical protein